MSSWSSVCPSLATVPKAAFAVTPSPTPGLGPPPCRGLILLPLFLDFTFSCCREPSNWPAFPHYLGPCSSSKCPLSTTFTAVFHFLAACGGTLVLGLQQYNLDSSILQHQPEKAVICTTTQIRPIWPPVDQANMATCIPSCPFGFSAQLHCRARSNKSF